MAPKMNLGTDIVAKGLEAVTKPFVMMVELSPYQLPGVFHEQDVGLQSLHVIGAPTDQIVTRVVKKVVKRLCPAEIGTRRTGNEHVQLPLP
jgi:hypothetical protein